MIHKILAAIIDIGFIFFCIEDINKETKTLKQMTKPKFKEYIPLIITSLLLTIGVLFPIVSFILK